MSFNKVILQGNLTRDPEVKTLPSGATVARLSLALNRTYSDKNGEKKEEVTFVDVDAFGKTADLIGKYFAKGSLILVEGRLKLDTWEDRQTGEKRSRMGVVLESFQFCGKGERSEGRSAPAPRSAERPAPVTAAAPDDSDVTF